MFGESFVKNIGHDKTGKHSEITNVHNVELSGSKFELKYKKIEEDEIVKQQLEEYLFKVLYDSHLKLSDVCFERLQLINHLTQTAEERLKIINSLSSEIMQLKQIINKK